MHRSDVDQFEMPVRLVLRPGGPVTEVYSPAEAMAVLFCCEAQEGPIYESALEACFSATMDHHYCEEARSALVAYGRAYGLLSPDDLMDAQLARKRTDSYQQ